MEELVTSNLVAGTLGDGGRDLRAMRSLADGNLEVEIKGANRSDEIGEMAR